MPVSFYQATCTGLRGVDNAPFLATQLPVASFASTACLAAGSDWTAWADLSKRNSLTLTHYLRNPAPASRLRIDPVGQEPPVAIGH